MNSLPLQRLSPLPAGNDTVAPPPRHGRARPDHPDRLERSAFPAEITGTRPVMT
jgi:hypothetical protein